MTSQVYLHVGAMKTGTTYLQKLLAVNAAGLRTAGVLVAPGRGPAVPDVLDYVSDGVAYREAVRGRWAELVRRTEEHDGRAMVLSHEYLSLKGPPYPERVVRSFPAAEVHVVLTVRDAAGTLPAQWQTSARNRGTMTWPEYVAAAIEDPARRGHTFLRAQRARRILAEWGALVPPERLHVVTVPPAAAGPDLLWERFAQVLGIDPALAPERTVPANPSTGYASAHLLCLLHRAAATARLPHHDVRILLVHLGEVLAARAATEPKPPLDEAALAFTADWNRRTRRAIKRSGASLVGSWADLPTGAAARKATPMALPTHESLLAAAQAARPVLAALAGPGGPAGQRTQEGEPRGRGSGEEAVDRLLALLRHAVEGGAAARVRELGVRPVGPAHPGRPAGAV